MLWQITRTASVSYTHLDVYKRQFLNYMKLNDEEDEGFYDDDYLDDEEEVEPVKKFGAAKNRQQAQDGQQHRKGHVRPDVGYCFLVRYRGRQRDFVYPFPYRGTGGGTCPQHHDREAFPE